MDKVLRRFSRYSNHLLHLGTIVPLLALLRCHPPFSTFNIQVDALGSVTARNEAYGFLGVPFAEEMADKNFIAYWTALGPSKRVEAFEVAQVCEGIELCIPKSKESCETIITSDSVGRRTFCLAP